MAAIMIRPQCIQAGFKQIVQKVTLWITDTIKVPLVDYHNPSKYHSMASIKIILDQFTLHVTPAKVEISHSTCWGLNKMVAMLQTIFSNAFLQMKIFWFKFNGSLFLKVPLTMGHLLGAKPLSEPMLTLQVSLLDYHLRMSQYGINNNNLRSITLHVIIHLKSQLAIIHLPDQHLEAQAKWLTFCRQYFQMDFVEFKVLYFVSNFTGVHSVGPIASH